MTPSAKGRGARAVTPSAKGRGARAVAPAWCPQPEEARATNVGRFMEAHGIASFEDLTRRSICEPEWFWDAVVRFLAINFTTPYDAVLDASDGAPWATWFVGGRLNLADVCVDRHAASDPSAAAVVWEGEDGEVRRWSYGELRAHTDALAALLAEHGVCEGDSVGVWMPMVPEAVTALLAVAKLGAVFLPLFSGYGPAAAASRLADAGAVALLSADGFLRRGRRIDLAGAVAEAAASVPTLRTVVQLSRLGGSAGSRPETKAPGVATLEWPTAGAGGRDPFLPREVASEHTLFVAYTSGTTGRPKGAVHVHGGFGVKVAEEGAFQLDCRRDDTIFWFTDMGWIMGPWEVFATLAAGATLLLYEGAPDHPGPDRLWELVERHRVSILGVSPTLVRGLLASGDEPVRSHDRSSLRVLGSTGEPWNERPWWWYFDVVGEGRCPVINMSGGTEVGACLLSPHPVTPIRPLSVGGPALGMAVDVLDEDGHPLRGEVGELVCTRPWPGMTRGLYRDPKRYLDTYWSRWPDVWVHGDWASIDADGSWFLHGRSDDTIKVAGKRLGPAEVESLLVSHPSVVEAAAVGLPDERKGESLWAFVVVAGGAGEGEHLRRELVDLVADGLGHAFRPAAVRFVDALPKTRNAKILRRAVSAAATGADLGDVSSLEDPAGIEAVRCSR